MLLLIVGTEVVDWLWEVGPPIGGVAAREC